MLNLDKAIRRCIDRCILDTSGDGIEIDRYMYMYKAIRDLPDDKYEEVYKIISKALFGANGYN